MKAWVKSIAAILVAAAIAGGAFWQGMAMEAAKISRFVDASMAVYQLVKDTPQGKALKAAYEQLWIAGKVKELLPKPASADAAEVQPTVAPEPPAIPPAVSASVKAAQIAPGTAPVKAVPTPVDIDTLRGIIDGKIGRAL